MLGWLLQEQGQQALIWGSLVGLVAWEAGASWPDLEVWKPGRCFAPDVTAASVSQPSLTSLLPGLYHTYLPGQ